MNNTNYCAEYLASRIKMTGDEHYDFNLKNNMECIVTGTKFRLPDDGVVLEVLPLKSLNESAIHTSFSKYIEHVKLPYESTVLEYLQITDVDGQEIKTKTIIFLSESVRDGIIASIAYSDSTSAGKWVVNETVIFIESDLSIRPTSLKGTMGKVTASDELAVLQATNVVLSFLAALQCSNVIQSDLPAPKFINKSRAKKGKLPLFSYKVLTIDTKGKTEQSKAGAGTGNTKRVHLRRGHIRRLTDKTVWVNPCVVGDKSKGMITKDYRVI